MRSSRRGLPTDRRMRRSIASGEIRGLDRPGLVRESVDPSIAAAHRHEGPVGRLGVGDRIDDVTSATANHVVERGVDQSACRVANTAGPRLTDPELGRERGCVRRRRRSDSSTRRSARHRGRGGVRAPCRHAARTRQLGPSSAWPTPSPSKRRSRIGSSTSCVTPSGALGETTAAWSALGTPPGTRSADRKRFAQEPGEADVDGGLRQRLLQAPRAEELHRAGADQVGARHHRELAPCGRRRAT